MALADIVNAGLQADLIEVRLDRFIKAPDISELVAKKRKPVIMCCRRRQDGGDWQGSEPERLALLRQCVVSKADYVEVELDVADQVRKMGPTKRIISYTNLKGTPRNIAEVQAAAVKKGADVVRIATAVNTPAEAWPVVQTLAQTKVPTVVAGIGQAGVTLSLLARKLGAPWTYAALEPGRRSYPGQPTLYELTDLYQHNHIQKKTRFVAVTSTSSQSLFMLGILNELFRLSGLPARCLPTTLGKPAVFKRLMNLLKLGAVVVGPADRGAAFALADNSDEAAAKAQAVDLLVPTAKGWHGKCLIWRAALAGLEQVLSSGAGGASAEPLKGRMVMVAGADGTGRAMAYGLSLRGAALIVASRNPKDGQFAAQLFQCRHIKFEGIYSTMHEVLVVCSHEEEKLSGKLRSGETGVHAGYLKPTMTVLDLTSMPQDSKLVAEARERECRVVEPKLVFLNHMRLLAKLLLNRDPGPGQLGETLERLKILVP